MKNNHLPYHMYKYSSYCSWCLILFYGTTLLIVLFLLSNCGTVPSAPQQPKTTVQPQLPPPTIFMLSNQGALASYQASGTLLWQSSATGGSTGGFTSTFGLGKKGKTLLVDGGSIYSGTSSVQSYNAHNGRQLWSHDLPSSTDNMLIAGQTLYVEASTITAWDKTSGALRWQQSDAMLSGGPMISNSRFLFVSGLTQTSALNQQTGTVIWHWDSDPGDSVQTMYLSGDGTILLLQTGTKFQALNASTGKLLWQRNSQPLALFLDTQTNTLYTSSIDIPDPSFSTASNQTWSGLRAIDLASGKTRWSTPLTLGLSDTSTISPTGIVVATATAITSWDLTGKQQWQVPYVGQPIQQIQAGSPASSLIFLFTPARNIVALDTSTGQQRWQTAVFPGMDYHMQSVGNVLWISDATNGTIAAYDAHGTQRWMLHVGAAIADGMIAS